MVLAEIRMVGHCENCFSLIAFHLFQYFFFFNFSEELIYGVRSHSWYTPKYMLNYSSSSFYSFSPSSSMHCSPSLKNRCMLWQRAKTFWAWNFKRTTQCSSIVRLTLNYTITNDKKWYFSTCRDTQTINMNLVLGFVSFLFILLLPVACISVDLIEKRLTFDNFRTSCAMHFWF